MSHNQHGEHRMSPPSLYLQAASAYGGPIGTAVGVCLGLVSQIMTAAEQAKANKEAAIYLRDRVLVLKPALEMLEKRLKTGCACVSVSRRAPCVTPSHTHQAPKCARHESSEERCGCRS